MSPNWNLWLERWATSLHIWAACGLWHHLPPTQTCLTPSAAEGQLPENFWWTSWRADSDNRHGLAHQTKNRTGIWGILYTLPSASEHIPQTWAEKRTTLDCQTFRTSAGKWQLQSPEFWSHNDFSGDWIINSQIDLSVLINRKQRRGKIMLENNH